MTVTLTLSASTRARLSQTGYYGRIDAQGRQRVSKVHVRRAGSYGPACGAKLHPEMAFHWCSMRPVINYIDCASCKAITMAEQPRAYTV